MLAPRVRRSLLIALTAVVVSSLVLDHAAAEEPIDGTRSEVTRPAGDVPGPEEPNEPTPEPEEEDDSSEDAHVRGSTSPDVALVTAPLARDASARMSAGFGPRLAHGGLPERPPRTRAGSPLRSSPL